MEIRVFISPNDAMLERFVNKSVECIILAPEGRATSSNIESETNCLHFNSKNLGKILKEKIEEYNPLGRKLVAYVNLAELEKSSELLKSVSLYFIFDKIYLFNTNSKVFPFQEYLALKQFDYCLEKVESFNDKLLYTFSESLAVNEKISYLNESLKKEKELRKLYELKLEVEAISSANIRVNEPVNHSSLINHLDISNFLTNGVLPPSFDGWAIDEDLALLLINRIVFGNFTHFIELGSGSSTRLIAKALQKIESPNKLLSIEHSENYLQKTKDLISRSNLQSLVSLNLCELASYQSGEEEYSYYDCGEILDEYLGISENSQVEKKVIFCLVDGPPGLTNNHARYPILPLLLERLNSDFSIYLYLDDFNRSQEKEIVVKWSELAAKKGYEFAVEEVKNKKGLCIFKVSDSKL
ncbi:MAG: hypothetical protein VYD79_06760 [Pseudomonadota bacterium]|nr:hypothetical protein [Pseudomonadota bacterium]|tara:strand:- start:2168 stop:3403 length:1236 start_codon:yes stop_codon:yes gene_type:complete